MYYDNLKLESDRLILRPPLHCDFEEFARINADTRGKCSFAPALNRDQSWADFCVWLDNWKILGFSQFSIIEKENGIYIGRAGPYRRTLEDFPEFGWSLAFDARNKGYGYEACKIILDWVQVELKLQKIYFCIHRDNLPSQNLASKLGAKFIGQKEIPNELLQEAIEVWRKSFIQIK